MFFFLFAQLLTPFTVLICSLTGVVMTARLECSGLRVAGRSMRLCVLVLCLLPHFGWAVSYKQGDPVILYVNKVGPYHNPQETYHYYTLPVCRPKEVSVHYSVLSGSISVLAL